MKLVILLQFVGFAVSTKLYKRAICTVNSLNDPDKDDAPAINSALETCAQGTTILPGNQTFTIQTPLNLSSCRACNLEINGILALSPDWNLWKSQPAAIQIPGTTAAVISSGENTGLINANNFGRCQQETNPTEITLPSLFSITNKSYQIHIRNLKTENVPGTAFNVTSGSSAVRFYGIEFVNSAGTGYHVEQAQHVYVWNNTVRATQTCVSIYPNSSNIQVEESTCIITATSGQSGFKLGFQDSSSMGLDWIRNILVRSVKAIGSMNVVVFHPGSSGGDGQPVPVEITNATFTDITISGPAKQAVLVEEGENPLTAKEISFNAFRGEVEENDEIKCNKAEDTCEFETKDWQLDVVPGK
ncbi:glycoside hydrolase family 28 protein [Periconia macrospinosa]|uniref:Glycoside hydrolase family 28 protein n=1 Tax=Periconia macrospinosa TaxID=97972 RepID=A0A2V1E509_9PLEO|nr:glycoside hydrolase family 28 protein [Periconia macrospinosa]